MRHMFFQKNAPNAIEAALSAAMHSLTEAQDITNYGRALAGLSLRNGCKAAYPETTGYIIETFYDYADHAVEMPFKSRGAPIAE